MNSISGVNFNNNISQSISAKKQNYTEKVNFTSQRDYFKLLNNEKVSFTEGLSLVGEGFISKIKNIAKTIITHPIKTLGTMALTSVGLMTLPFIGISMTTGGAAMAVLFGGSAIANTLKNVYCAVKSANNGDNNQLRRDLKNIGGNFLDLALTVPFLPKSISHIKLNAPLLWKNKIAVVKDANGKVVSDLITYRGGLKCRKFDTTGKVISEQTNSLFQQIKAAKTWKEKFKRLTHIDRKEAAFAEINKAYKQVAISRGFKRPKDIRYFSSPIEVKSISFSNGNVTVKPKPFVGGCVRTNSPDIVNINECYTHIASLQRIIKSVGHEFRHVEQNAMMEAAEGIQMSPAFSVMKSHKDYVIKRGTPEHAMAVKFKKALDNYGKTKNNNSAYLKNELEVDARNVGEVEIASQIKAQIDANTGINTTKSPITYNPTKEVLMFDGRELSNFTEAV